MTNSKKKNDFRRVCLPYCLQRLSDGTWLPLNRHYKPLGTKPGEWVDYEKADPAARLKLSATKLKAVDWKGLGEGEQVFLYNDGCIPEPGTPHWTAYCLKLAKLAD